MTDQKAMINDCLSVLDDITAMSERDGCGERCQGCRYVTQPGLPMPTDRHMATCPIGAAVRLAEFLQGRAQ